MTGRFAAGRTAHEEGISMGGLRRDARRAARRVEALDTRRACSRTRLVHVKGQAPTPSGAARPLVSGASRPLVSGAARAASGSVSPRALRVCGVRMCGVCGVRAAPAPRTAQRRRAIACTPRRLPPGAAENARREAPRGILMRRRAVSSASLAPVRALPPPWPAPLRLCTPCYRGTSRRRRPYDVPV